MTTNDVERYASFLAEQSAALRRKRGWVAVTNVRDGQEYGVARLVADIGTALLTLPPDQVPALVECVHWRYDGLPVVTRWTGEGYDGDAWAEHTVYDEPKRRHTYHVHAIALAAAIYLRLRATFGDARWCDEETGEYITPEQAAGPLLPWVGLTNL